MLVTYEFVFIYLVIHILKLDLFEILAPMNPFVFVGIRKFCIIRTVKF